MLKFIKDSWKEKMDKSNSMTKTERLELQKGSVNFYNSLDSELKNKIEKCYYFHSWKNFYNDIDKICLEYLPFWKNDTLFSAGLEKEFFKQYYNWKKLNDSEKKQFDRLILFFYNNSLTSIYRHYVKTNLKLEVDF